MSVVPWAQVEVQEELLQKSYIGTSLPVYHAGCSEIDLKKMRLPIT